MIYNIDDRFPNRGNWKYRGETIREVLHKDSGYIKDLIKKNDCFALSDECMDEAKLITRGHRDERVRKSNPNNVFEGLIVYGIGTPYGYDFNNDEIQKNNKMNQRNS